MADGDNFDYEELDVRMEGDAEVLMNYSEDYNIVKKIDKFSTQLFTEEALKIENTDCGEPLDVEIVDVKNVEPQQNIVRIATTDELLDVDPLSLSEEEKS